MKDSNFYYTSIDDKIKLESYKLEANIEEVKQYQAAIGLLFFLILATRLDLAYSIIKLARYASNPSPIHANAVKRVFRYLKDSINLGIYIKQNINNSYYINSYCDVDYARNLATYKSTSDYIFYIENFSFIQKSKLQSIIAQSFTESEYIAINTTAKKAIYIKYILSKLDLYK